jgi:hypothetical protein
MSIFALLAPIVLIAAMLVLFAFARREFRPKPRQDRDLVTHLGMSDPAAWTPRKGLGSTHVADGAMDGGDGAVGGDGGDGGGDGGGD